MRKSEAVFAALVATLLAVCGLAVADNGISGYEKRSSGAMTSDTAPTDTVLRGRDAYPAGSATTGGDLFIAPGLGRSIGTVVDWTQGAGDTFRVLQNLTVLDTTLTEGADFTAETSNAVTATNIAAAVTAIVGVSAVAVGSDIQVTADASTFEVNLVTGDATAWTVTNTADGEISLKTNGNVGLTITPTGTNFDLWVNVLSGWFRIADDIKSYIGGNNDTLMEWSTVQTNDGLLWGIEGGSASQGGYVALIEASNVSGNYALAAKTNPTLAIYSQTAAGSATDEALLLSHDVTDGVIETLSGDLRLEPAGGTRLAFALEDTTTTSGAPNVIIAAESNGVISNQGTTGSANYQTLPTAAAGLVLHFVANDADQLMRITAASGDTITIHDATTSAAGYVQSVVAGEGCLTLLALDNTAWLATLHEGDWDVYDGSALNPATGLFAEYYIANGDKAATGGITAGTALEVAGTATAGTSRGFTIATATGGRATYNGTHSTTFLVTINLSAASTETGEFVLGYVAVSGTKEISSEQRRELAAAPGDIGAMTLTAIVTLAEDQYVECYVDLQTSAGDSGTVTAENLTVTIVEVGH